MSIDPIELGRLAKTQIYPQRYVERRVEHLDLKDDHYYGVRVVEQLVIAQHGPTEDTDERDLLIPIGYFAKPFIPELEVRGPDGCQLPVLNRIERGRIIAVLFTSGWEKTFFTNGLNRADDDGQAIWRQLQDHVAEIATEQPPEAKQRLEDLRELLKDTSKSCSVGRGLREACHRILGETQFWTSLTAVVETRLVMATLRGTPGRTYVISAEYSERFRYDVKRSSVLTRLLIWLGWLYVGVSRTVANIGRTQSLWVTQSLPDGVEALRFFWEDRQTAVRDPEASVESDRVLANRYQSPYDAGKPVAPLLLDAQVAPAASMATALALAAVLFVVTTYIYQTRNFFHSDSGSANFVALAGAFAAVPAALTGALAYRGQAFVRRVSRGPRKLLALLSAQAAFLAILIGIKRVGSGVALSSYLLSVYSFAMIGIFGYIQYGPRWRKTERTRMRGRTINVSPADCRKHQKRLAVAFLLGLAASTIVFARCQFALRDVHFFHHFPRDIWRAWWSFFGLAKKP